MAENTIKKIATRESYGNALKELGEEFPDLVVLDADLARRLDFQKSPVFPT